MRNRWLLALLGIILLGGMTLPMKAAPPDQVHLGVSGGWSWGTSWEFGWKFRGHSSQNDELKYHVGAFVEFPLVRLLSLQLAADYQAAIDEMTWHFTVPGPLYESRDRFHIFSLSMNGVFEIPLGRRLSVYAQGGGGPSWGDWVNYFDGTYFHIEGGLGFRLALGPRNRYPCLILGGAFRHLFDTGEFSSYHASYVRAFVGIGL